MSSPKSETILILGTLLRFWESSRNVADANLIAHQWFSQESGKQSDYDQYTEDHNKHNESLHIYAENTVGTKWNIDVDKRILQRRVPVDSKNSD